MQASQGKQVKLYANYFRFKMTKHIFKYRISTEPQIPSNEMGLLYRVLGKIKEELQKSLIVYSPIGFSIYSPTAIDELILNGVKYENQEYSITITQSGILNVEEDREATNFLGRFFKTLQAKLKFKQVGRKYFRQDAPFDFPNFKLKIWPGYATSLNLYGQNILINIDSAFKVLRETTVYEVIDEYKNKFPDADEKIREELIGMTIMTR